MKIYNENKTQELDESELDFSLGHLVEDKIVSAHHEATKAIPAKSIAEQVAEHSAAGREIMVADGKTYYIEKVFANGGKSAVRIEDLPAVPAKDAYDEYDEIRIYVPYTDEELQSIANNKRHAELQAELAKIKEDIEQEGFGLVRDDYPEKKARAAEIINELRVLEGKAPRAVRPSVL